MLKLDLDFSKFITGSKPAPEPVLKSTKNRKGKGFGTILGLGNAARLTSLPETVDEAFLEQYQEGLDKLLTMYVTAGQLTITEATQYKDYIFGSIFGTHEHLGLFQYIRAKGPELYDSEKDMVNTAEAFLMKGWRIAQDGDRWYIVDDTLSRLMDVTGATDISETSGTRTFSPDTAHIFLADDVASRVAALARRSGFDADSLVSMGQLDLLLSSTDNKEMAGYLLNYNTLRFILKKSGKYKTNNTDITYSSLYDDGYRIGSQIFYPTLSKAILEKSDSQVLLTTASSDIHEQLGLNVSALAVLAATVRQDLYRGKVIPQKLDEVNEFGQSVALLTEFWTTDAVRTSSTELYDVLNRLDYNYRVGELSEKHYHSVRQSFAEILITEVFLLGNDRFTLGSFGYDTVGGKFFVYAGERVFHETPEDDVDHVNLQSYGREFFQQCMRARFSPSFVEKNLTTLLSYASDGFKKRLRTVKADTKRYGEHTYEQVDLYVSQRLGRLADALS